MENESIVGERVWPASTCSSCGLKMEPGQSRYCQYGGLCSWFIPVAAYGRMLDLRTRVQDLETELLRMTQLRDNALKEAKLAEAR